MSSECPPGFPINRSLRLRVVSRWLSPQDPTETPGRQRYTLGVMVTRRDMLIASAFVMGGARRALSSTWVDVEVTCPVCATVNVFKIPGSFGTYVYQEPSRYQYVFWPASTDFFVYTCRRCHLSTYMSDFEAIPPDKITALAVMLEREAEIVGPAAPYFEIPVTTRLDIARTVYGLLGRDELFWCEFERINGYHLAEAGEPKSAHAARGRALGLAEGLLAKEARGTAKETLVIIGTMRFFTGDLSGARTALDDASERTFTGEDREAAGLDGFLTQLIDDFRSAFLTQTGSR